MYIKFTKYNFRNDASRWQISKSPTSLFTFFTLGVTYTNYCNRQTHTQPMATDEILQICVKSQVYILVFFHRSEYLPRVFFLQLCMIPVGERHLLSTYFLIIMHGTRCRVPFASNAIIQYRTACSKHLRSACQILVIWVRVWIMKYVYNDHKLPIEFIKIQET